MFEIERANEYSFANRHTNLLFFRWYTRLLCTLKIILLTRMTFTNSIDSDGWSWRSWNVVRVHERGTWKGANMFMVYGIPFVKSCINVAAIIGSWTRKKLRWSLSFWPRYKARKAFSMQYRYRRLLTHYPYPSRPSSTAFTRLHWYHGLPGEYPIYPMRLPFTLKYANLTRITRTSYVPFVFPSKQLRSRNANISRCFIGHRLSLFHR